MVVVKNMASSTLYQSIGLMVNGLIIAALNVIESYFSITSGSRRKSHESLILSLSLSDCLVGFATFSSELIVILLHCHQVITSEEEEIFKIEEGVKGFIWFSVYSSLFHIITITVDRGIAVIYPTQHKVWITPWRTKVCIIIAWLISLVMISVSAVVFYKASSDVRFNLKWIKICFAGLCLCIGFLVGLSYFFIIKRAIFDRKRSIKNLSGNTEEKRTTQKERRLLFISLSIVLSFVACMFPYSIEVAMLKEESYIAQFLLVSNSFLNSLTYFYGRYLDKKR